MAIQFVGWATATGNSQTASYIYSNSLTGGIDTEARTGDVVIGVCGYSSVVKEGGFYDSEGGTLLADLWVGANGNYESTLDVQYWVMGETPKTSYRYWGVGNNLNAQAIILMVFRNVSLSNPIDVTTTTANAIGSAYPNSPSITPVTVGAWILAVGSCTGDTSMQTKTGPANMPNFYDLYDLDNVVSECGTAASYITWSGSGAFDPDAWTGGESSGAHSWTAATIALRPATRSTLYYEVALPR